MKQLRLLLTALVIIFALAACTQEARTPAPAPEPAPVAPSVDEQIDALLAQKDVWLSTQSAFTPFYALTDVNEDGFLELMRCEPGDDWSSAAAFFAIDKDGSTVKALAFPYGEDHSHPDLVDRSSYRLYAGEDGVYLIAVDDIYHGPVQASDYSATHALVYLSLGEDRVDAGDIAYCDMRDEDTNGDALSEYHMYYYAAGGIAKSLDANGYVNAPAERFEGYAKKVCNLRWWTPPEQDATDDETLKFGLNESWNGFSIRQNDAQFEELIQDPYVDFYASGAGGPPFYFEGDEVSYFPSFVDIRGTWYLEYAWTDAGTWYVGGDLAPGELNILMNGQLSANYYNEADPRGAYLFTEMNMVEDTRALGTDKDDWCITFESAGAPWQMQLRPDPENQRLYVTWYEWEDEARTSDPIGVNLVYSRIAG